MNFDDIVKSNILNISQNNTYTGTFREYFNRRLDDYLSLVSQLDESSLSFKKQYSSMEKIYSIQEKFVQGLKATINLYYDGTPSKAYDIFSNTISTRLKTYKKLLKIEEYDKDENFYRIRVIENSYEHDLENFFHIPFHLREKVSTQRFSIPGFPSLYLGRSVYVCWEELNRPNLSDFHVTRFLSQKKLKYIDLSPPYLEGNLNTLKYYKYLMTWPLIFASTIKVKLPNDTFKPEYIIPQLLLQWTKQEKEIDGIRYWSTHVNKSSMNFRGELFNLVLPVVENNDEGLCPKLINKFKGTEILSWQSIEMTSGGGVYLSSKNEDDIIDQQMEYIDLIKGKKSKYSSTMFGKLEKHLSYLTPRKINNKA